MGIVGVIIVATEEERRRSSPGGKSADYQDNNVLNEKDRQNVVFKVSTMLEQTSLRLVPLGRTRVWSQACLAIMSVIVYVNKASV